jgi:hypothetical protein
MKKLSAALVLCAILGICASSQGYFLIYKITTSVKGIDDETPVRVPWKAYLVMKFDDSGDSFLDSSMLMYGKDNDKQKVYLQLNYTVDEYLYTDMWYKGEYICMALDGQYRFAFDGLLTGKMRTTDIGLGTEKSVAKSMKGVIEVDIGMLLDDEQDITGTGNISASLWRPLTRRINETTPTLTQAEVISLLKSEYLEDYTDATP